MAYFPNGSAGEVLDAQCFDCPLGAGWHDLNQKRLFEDEPIMKPCPVACVQLSYNYDQLDKGQQRLREAITMLVSDEGTCQVRKLLAEDKT